MTICKDVGRSAVTPAKHEHLQALLHMELQINRKYILRGWPFVYIETHAGTGYYWLDGQPLEEGPQLGSPIEALLELDRNPIFRNKQARYAALFVDQHRTYAKRLRTFIQRAELGRYGHCEIVSGQCQEALPAIARRVRIGSRGLIFVDPNGLPPQGIFDVFQQPQLARIDVALWIDLRTIRRVLAVKRWPDHFRGKEIGDRRPTADLIASIPKQRWLVRRPFVRANSERTMVIGTNWTDFPIWTAGGYVPLDSLEGRSIIGLAAAG